MTAKPPYLTNRQLFEKVVNSNPSLFKQLTWSEMWKTLLDELFPRSRRILSLGLTFTIVILSVIFTWYLWLSPFTESYLVGAQESSVQSQNIQGTESFRESINETAWEYNLSSLLVGRFWYEE